MWLKDGRHFPSVQRSEWAVADYTCLSFNFYADCESARIRLDAADLTTSTSRRNAACHEIGHSGGLRHGGTVDRMQTSSGSYTTYSPHHIDHLNNKGLSDVCNSQTPKLRRRRSGYPYLCNRHLLRIEPGRAQRTGLRTDVQRLRSDVRSGLHPSELADWSTAVVEGRVVDIIAGREHGRNADDPSLALTVTIVVDVDEVLHGQADDRVYVEMPSPGNTPASEYKDVGVGLPVLLYLIPAEHEPGIIIDESAGRPKGEPLFQLTNPEGMVVGGEASVTQILEFTTYPGASLEDFYPDRTEYPEEGDVPEGPGLGPPEDVRLKSRVR